MHVYTGKLNWYNYAVDEIFTIVVPNVFNYGEPILAYWQWTQDDSGTKKKNVSVVGKIDSIIHTASEQKIGFFYDQYYKFDAVVGSDDKSLVVTMRNPKGDKSGPINLQLSYSK
ncbi:hypothetical protein BC936DRAFT_144228 [Jimgerdemannia flammicorona]|uniref:Uncharacterized protein n=1 Tax=Jimgerdemannia flammicorona TaxID=994334 RepID=A0A433DCV9_9FUNG|nr:hypothetical protein BC936DRAFT_144228 [Jimgerdemannia flammicorona]